MRPDAELAGGVPLTSVPSGMRAGRAPLAGGYRLVRKLLVLKVGGASAPMPGRPGDCEDGILAGMQLERGQALVIDVCTE